MGKIVDKLVDESAKNDITNLPLLSVELLFDNVAEDCETATFIKLDNISLFVGEEVLEEDIEYIKATLNKPLQHVARRLSALKYKHLIKEINENAIDK